MNDISAQEVKKAIDTNENYILLDVRTPQEFSRGKIEGAINIPVDDVPQMIGKAIPDKNATIYVYCLSASRSPIAVEIMEELGYTNAFNMEHGLMAWRMYKFPMVS
jgi:rhodanese-related sulfurtransferase